jgi:hypothetical protein
VDYDPAGLVIASSLPHLEGIVAPESSLLIELLERYGLEDRYLTQLPSAAPMLDRAGHPAIAGLWSLLRQVGRALPQEKFIGL